jgi:hypothetical protein
MPLSDVFDAMPYGIDVDRDAPGFCADDDDDDDDAAAI